MEKSLFDALSSIGSEEEQDDRDRLDGRTTGMLIAIGFVGIVFFVLAADQYRKYTQFTPVPARVTRVNQSCRLIMEAADESAGEKEKSTPPIDCRAAKSFAATPEWRGAELRAEQDVAFTYVSPVDQKSHEGHFKDSGAHVVLRTVGDQITIRASRTKAELTREP